MRNSGSSEHLSPLKTNGTKSKQNRSSTLLPSILPSGIHQITHPSYPHSTLEFTNEYSKTNPLPNIIPNHTIPNGTALWRTTPTSTKDFNGGEMENPDYTFIWQPQKEQNWPASDIGQKGKNGIGSAACATNWNLTEQKSSDNSNSDSNMSS
jgi:hypothetical protein